jgi:hypothetical protein
MKYIPVDPILLEFLLTLGVVSMKKLIFVSSLRRVDEKKEIF